MKAAIQLLVISSLLIFFSGCDYVDQPIPEEENISIDTSGITWDTMRSEENLSKRNIVIEEFTGHTCKECPEGAKEIQRLEDIYKDQLITVSIHAGTFAEPQDNPDGSFSTDFRTEAGEDYNNTFSVFFYPAAMVSRTENGGAGSGNYIYSKGDWENVMQSIENDQPLISIDITSLYSDSLNTGKVTVETEWLQSTTGTYKLQVQLLEDNITDWQISGSQYIEDYLHRHTLRKAINSSWGTEIPSTSAGDTDTQEFEYTVEEGWKEKDLIVVAYVYNDGNYEVIQGAEVHVMDH